MEERHKRQKYDFYFMKLCCVFQGDIMCKGCFYHAFEEEIHHTIVAGKLFTPGETVAIGASGGKGMGRHHLHPLTAVPSPFSAFGPWPSLLP